MEHCYNNVPFLYKFKCYIQVDYFIPAFALIAAGTASL